MIVTEGCRRSPLKKAFKADVTEIRKQAFLVAKCNSIRDCLSVRGSVGQAIFEKLEFKKIRNISQLLAGSRPCFETKVPIHPD